ncbi:MAG: CsgE family curli-type amyloid fiber assembly protein [Massilia sp.]
MPSTARSILVSLLSIVCAFPARAEPEQAAMPETHIEALGIVTNQAVTVAGHEFCNHFIAEWRDKPGSERYTLAIRERPSARWGSLIWVDFGQQRLLQLQLPPARPPEGARGERGRKRLSVHPRHRTPAPARQRRRPCTRRILILS